MIKNSKGASVLIFVLILGVLALLFQSNLASDFLNMQRDWKDSSTFANKNYESYRQYVENPLPSIVNEYLASKEEIAPSDQTNKNFASVMEELLKVRKPID